MITVAVVDSTLNLLRIYIYIYAMVLESMIYVNSLAIANTLNYGAVTSDGDLTATGALQDRRQK